MTEKSKEKKHGSNDKSNKDKIIEPKRKLTEPELKNQKIGELTDTLQKLQAEFENFKKRIQSENANCIKLASKDIIIKLLPTLDNFELALKNTENKDDFIRGMELIYSQLVTALEAEGLKPIDTLNKKFDPYYHEALMQDNKEDKDNEIITEELQKGYLLNDEVIRHSKVKVNKR